MRSTRLSKTTLFLSLKLQLIIFLSPQKSQSIIFSDILNRTYFLQISENYSICNVFSSSACSHSFSLIFLPSFGIFKFPTIAAQYNKDLSTGQTAVKTEDIQTHQCEHIACLNGHRPFQFVFELPYSYHDMPGYQNKLTTKAGPEFLEKMPEKVHKATLPCVYYN